MEDQLDPLTKRIVGAAIAVHRYLGPGLLESVYRTALALETESAGLAFEPERVINLTYRGRPAATFGLTSSSITPSLSKSKAHPLTTACLMHWC